MTEELRNQMVHHSQNYRDGLITVEEYGNQMYLLMEQYGI